MPSIKSSRKRQARLEFTPLPSSSPAAKHYHNQIQDRAAAVTIQGSPRSKRRGIPDASEDDVATLPTPTGTTNGEPIEGSDSEPVRTTQKARRLPSMSRPRQKRLDFTGARDSDTFVTSPRPVPSRPVSSGKGIFSSAGQPRMVELSSDSDSDLPSARKVMARTKQKAPEKEVEKTKKKRVTRSSQRLVVLSDSEQEGIAVAKKVTENNTSDEENSGEDMPTTEGRLPRQRKRRKSIGSFISDSPQPAADSDEDVFVVRKPSRKRKRQDDEIGDDEDQAEADDTVKTPGRRLGKRPKQLSQRERNDLAEDLAALGSGSNASSPQPPRSAQSAEKNARQRALERLKKSRGQPLEQVEEEQADDIADDSAAEEGSQDESEVEEVAPPMSSRQMFGPDEEDDDFLVEEGDDDPLGIPDGVPLQFTRYASMKSKELFKFAILWMVQKKINPGFDMNAEIFALTFQKLDDEVRGLAGSKFTSSAWTPEFTIALQARPEIAYQKPGGALKDKCDACNRSAHPATYEVQFHKKPYIQKTLDDVDNGDDEDEDDSDSSDKEDAADFDAVGRLVPSQSTLWYVGKFCTKNAITAHALNHWKWQLYEVVVEWLQHKGYLKADKIVQRDKMSTKKRAKQAHKILARIEDEGELNSLWKTFRESIDAARDSKQGRYAVDSP